MYQDNNCFFRCLALHQGASIHALEGHTKNLKTQLEEHTKLVFGQAVTLGHIPAIEVKFYVSIATKILFISRG